jgi:hypothetical protein
MLFKNLVFLDLWVNVSGRRIIYIRGHGGISKSLKGLLKMGKSGVDTCNLRIVG